jgi:hypothetical protein
MANKKKGPKSSKGKVKGKKKLEFKKKKGVDGTPVTSGGNG